MSEEPVVNKDRPSSALPDAEYDLIYATVSETAQGRSFLEEYARRSRPSDTEASLAAIERMQAAIRGGGTSERLQILLEMADMAQAIVHLRAEMLAMRPPGAGQLDATEELDSIVQTTESAASRILAAAEQVQEIAWTMRESGSIVALCDELDAQATEIYTACSFQDLTGQRTRKVIQVLRYLEERLNALVAQDKVPAGADDSSAKILIQAGVDAVMQAERTPPEAASEDRQDATLEDISRVMLAIEPTIALPQTAAANPTDVRPELSVAEAVMAEDDAARKLAEWAVDPAALARPKQEEKAPLVDWVVEDPQAPQPDSEPAWMILRRMEAQNEANTKAEVSALAPIPQAPAAPVMAEPGMPQRPPPEAGLFVAEAMSQLAKELRPVSLLPPPELTFRSRLPLSNPLAELATAMSSGQMKLLQPGEDAISPETAEAIKNARPEPSKLLQRAAAVTDPRPSEQQTEVGYPNAEADPDDFLFALEEDKRQTAPPQQTSTVDPPPPTEWKAGTFPNPALVTPQTLQAREPEVGEVKSPSPPHDPLAPLRAMSDAQKIALFS